MGEGNKILVIEDETTQRILAKDYLEESGYIVRLADDGQRGLEMASVLKPDLILLDLLLPSLDGYTLCTRLKENPDTAEIPVILVTASRETDVIERGMEAGASDFVTKPVDWNYLSDRVDHVLQQSRDMNRMAEEKRISEQKMLTLLQSKDLSPEQIKEIKALSVPSADYVTRDEHKKEIEAVRADAEKQVRAVREAYAADLAQAAESLEKTRQSFWSVLSHTSQSVVPTLAALDRLTSHGTVVDGSETSDASDTGKRPKNAVQALLAAAQNMTLLSRYMSGDVPAVHAQVDVNDVVREIAVRVQDQAARKNITVQVELPAEPMMVTADREQLDFAVLGLVLNALQHSSENAQMRIGAAAEDGGTVALTVEDSGVGMSSTTLDAVRKSDVMPANALKGDLAQFGFGLPMAMAVMKSHNGSLSIDSSVGSGTRVAVRMAAAQVQSEAQPTTREPLEEAQEKPLEKDVPIARLNALLAGES